MLKKTIKWSLVLAVAAGLASCMMDGTRNEQAPMPYEQQAKVKAAKGSKTASAGKVSSSSAKEPVQKSTPGPKRAAAPQLPVIQ